MLPSYSFSCYACTGPETMTSVRYCLANWTSKTLLSAHYVHALMLLWPKELHQLYLPATQSCTMVFPDFPLMPKPPYPHSSPESLQISSSKTSLTYLVTHTRPSHLAFTIVQLLVSCLEKAPPRPMHILVEFLWWLQDN
jgi:hypothetical protein